MDFQNLCFIFFYWKILRASQWIGDMARIVNNSYKWRKPSPHAIDFEVEYGLNPHSTSTVSNPILYLLRPPPPNVQLCKLHVPVVQYQKWKGCLESFTLDSYMTKQQRKGGGPSPHELSFGVDLGPYLNLDGKIKINFLVNCLSY
jgi:hypothetical protein